MFGFRFGPYLCQPVIAGLGEDDKPFICTMDSIGAKYARLLSFVASLFRSFPCSVPFSLVSLVCVILFTCIDISMEHLFLLELCLMIHKRVGNVHDSSCCLLFLSVSFVLAVSGMSFPLLLHFVCFLI